MMGFPPGSKRASSTSVMPSLTQLLPTTIGLVNDAVPTRFPLESSMSFVPFSPVEVPKAFAKMKLPLHCSGVPEQSSSIMALRQLSHDCGSTWPMQVPYTPLMHDDVPSWQMPTFLVPEGPS
jgi:hypothetical protein